MSDRLVQQLDPEAPAGEELKPFSAYSERPNIVLLGDPGAGKTHLFRHFSGTTVPLRARDFLTISADMLRHRKTLYIDALDEKRSGRGDLNTVDAIVSRLGEVKPERVRIACRVADWLGTSDLTAFRNYFDHTGGVTVLGLRALTVEEQISVLRSRNVTLPERFLEDATFRGLEELLVNPQNLLMLCEVVEKNGAWPKSRGELYSSAVDLLLTEHNTERARRDTGAYTATELWEPAGAICALRLIADVDGISLENSTKSDTYPSYRTISIYESELVMAALGRRAFVSGAAPETVDYVHRTVAEYLAAAWLAGRIQAGLPLGRVRALIGVDGRPASELRGLHAWLAILLPGQSASLIDADPFGVLSYGDAASLSAADRLRLLRSLAKLAEQDPWFREGNWSTSAIAALSGSELRADFSNILKNRGAGYSIRSIVLDALTAGQAIAELNGDLRDMLLDTELPVQEREAALDALVNARESAEELIVESYAQLGTSSDDLLLRARALKKFAGTALPVAAVASLLTDTLHSPDEISGGAFWAMSLGIKDEHLAEVLDRWSETDSESSADKNRRNLGEIILVVDDLLIRVLSLPDPISEGRLLKWLEHRERLGDHYSYGRVERVRELLRANPARLAALIEKAITDWAGEARSWLLLSKISRVLAGAADNDTLLQTIVRLLRQATVPETRVILYEMAMNCCFQVEISSRPIFEQLLALADGDSDLESARARSCFWEVPAWRVEESERRQKEKAKRTAGIAKTREDFEKDKQAILSGAHFGWMQWIANVYFARFSDVDHQATPYKRLATELGAQNALLAVQGLIAFVATGHISSETDIIAMHLNDRYYQWWYAVIAGLDEYAAASRDLRVISDSYARSALLIDALHGTYAREGNVSREISHSWVTTLIETRPELVADVYRTLAKEGLKRDAGYIYGMHELTSLDQFKPFRAQIARDLLEEFPTVSAQTLRHLLPFAMRAPDAWGDQIAQALTQCQQAEKQDSAMLWLAVGLILDFDRFRPLASGLAADMERKLLWAIRDLGALGIENASASVSDPQALKFLLTLAARHFTRAELPEGGWRGDTSPWDASQFVLRMISLLSADLSPAAIAALEELRSGADLQSFHDDIKHAIAKQRIRLIDSAFVQPSWDAALKALSKGAPANIADLHALVLSHLRDLATVISFSNTDVYKRFWNEAKFGKPSHPKVEESCRDALIDILRPLLRPYGIAVEPEGHMAADKRADVAFFFSGMKLVMELKKDNHKEVWSAMNEQLDRFYTRDPQAQGYGIYGVFWFGDQRKGAIPKMINGDPAPSTSQEMEVKLGALVPENKRDKIVPIVVNVAVPV